MSTRSRVRFGPIARLSLGLMALLISLILISDMVLGVVPNHTQAQRQIRQRIAENLTIQITGLLQRGDETMVARTIQQVLAQDRDIRSVSVYRQDGSPIMRRGAAEPAQAEHSGEGTAANVLRVPVYADQQLWGVTEVRFAGTEPDSAWGWLSQPGVQFLVVLGLAGFALSYLYLRRAMQYLDPSATVPDRVRKAYDTFTEGVVILDQRGRIMLANRAFRRLGPKPNEDLHGQPIDDLTWLRPSPSADQRPPAAPWTQTLETGAVVDAEPLTLASAECGSRKLLVTSAPIADGKGRQRGCMVTLDDVTPVHRINDELRVALADLERSRAKIEAQNLELLTLATRDPLTGCLNRRAFFEAGEAAFDTASKSHTEYCCVMADIDHFKQFNDLHGHPVGDQVIQVVARSLTAGLRPTEILGRYGGEEFCIVLPGASLEMAVEIAERLRAKIQLAAQSAIRGTKVGPITASFGVSTLSLGARSLPELIEQADQALYQSKANGRNKVTAFARE